MGQQLGTLFGKPSTEDGQKRTSHDLVERQQNREIVCENRDFGYEEGRNDGYGLMGQQDPIPFFDIKGHAHNNVPDLSPDAEKVREVEYVRGNAYRGQHGEAISLDWTILETVGSGSFSKVFRGWSRSNNFGAIKILNSDGEAHKIFEKEKKLLLALEKGNKNHPGYELTLHLMYSFDIISSTNRTHHCFAFELGSSDLQQVLERNGRGFHLNNVKQIMRQVLLAMDYLNSCGIIHTDLKPANILLKMSDVEKKYTAIAAIKKDIENGSEPFQKEVKMNTRASRRVVGQTKSCRLSSAVVKNMTETYNISRDDLSKSIDLSEPNLDLNDPLAKIEIQLIDIGCGILMESKNKPQYIQTIQYRAPEIVLGLKYDKNVDIFSAACVAYEIAAGELLFDTRRSLRFSEDSHLLSMMVATLGDFPVGMRTNGAESKDYFNKKLRLKDFPNAVYDANILSRRVAQTTSWSREEVDAFEDLLRNMLKYDPKERFTIQQCLDHIFLTERDSDTFVTGIKRKASPKSSLLPKRPKYFKTNARYS